MTDNQLLQNYQDQWDELEGIRMIYDEEFQAESLPESAEQIGETPLEYQLIIQPNMPPEKVQVHIISDQNMIGRFAISYLPAVTISFSLPKEYPANSPPQFTISSMWLTQANLTKICHQFDQICETQNGFPVIFTLCDWIKCELMDTVIDNTNNSINIEVASTEEAAKELGWDPRGVSQCINIEDTVLSLMRYDRSQFECNYYREPHTCNLCFEEMEGNKFHLMSCCTTGFCLECLEGMCKTLVKQGSVELLKCPNCRENFHPNLLKEFLDGEEFERFERLMLQKTLESMNDVHYCPRCETIVISEDDIGRCTKCAYRFCVLCRGEYHTGTNCDRLAARLKEIRSHRFYDQEVQSLKEINKIAKHCPNCKAAIERTAGCNKMTCTVCHSYFCYSCGEGIAGYDHFNNDKARCKLFDNTPEIMLQFAAVRRPPRADPNDGMIIPGFFFHGTPKCCPYCGQRNVKMDRNNDTRCWFCYRHFCFTCGIGIKGTAHFIGGKCVQHSDE